MVRKKTFGVLSIGCSIFLVTAQTRADFGIPITSPAVLNTNAATDGGTDQGSQVATDGDGNWVAVWESGDSFGGTIGFDFDILVSRSTDNGATWTSPETLNTNADSDSGQDSQPQVTTDGNGNWLAVWTSDDDLDDTIGTDKDILLAVSTNNGATWTDPEALNTNADTDSGNDDFPQLTTDDGTNWVAVWRSTDTLGSTIGTDPDILLAVSTDDGDTWTDPAALNTDADTEIHADWDPQIATDGAGNWVAVWGRAAFIPAGADFDIFVSRSTDDGDTWTTPEALNTNAATDSGEDFGPQVTTDGDGNWVAVWRSNDTLGGTIGTDGDILFAQSTDDGDTWTSPAALNSDADSDGLSTDDSPQITTDGEGNWVAIWHSTNTLGGTIGFDSDIMVARSEDDGDTWTDMEEFNTNADSDSGGDTLPQLTTDGASNWVAVWTSRDTLGGTIGTDGDILVARFQICNVNGECDDENDCTADTCVDNVCTFTDEDSGTTCDDGLFCTATDECDGSGSCVGTGSPCFGQLSKCCECSDWCISPRWECFCM